MTPPPASQQLIYVLANRSILPVPVDLAKATQSSKAQPHLWPHTSCPGHANQRPLPSPSVIPLNPVAFSAICRLATHKSMVPINRKALSLTPPRGVLRGGSASWPHSSQGLSGFPTSGMAPPSTRHGLCGLPSQRPCRLWAGRLNQPPHSLSLVSTQNPERS